VAITVVRRVLMIRHWVIRELLAPHLALSLITVVLVSECDILIAAPAEDIEIACRTGIRRQDDILLS